MEKSELCAEGMGQSFEQRVQSCTRDKDKHTRTHVTPYIQAHRRRRTGAQAHRRAGAQARRRTGAQARRRTGAQAHRRAGAQKHRRASGAQALKLPRAFTRLHDMRWHALLCAISPGQCFMR